MLVWWAVVGNQGVGAERLVRGYAQHYLSSNLQLTTLGKEADLERLRTYTRSPNSSVAKVL